ncbi:hypothetical protein LUZ60_002898 [Juncus effusus]|nr:hypothetical protein LUZ60_002898 [Juncus effusus]
MAEMEVAKLKEALYDQYMMMTNLYMELEEEREASATAASEALAMILRLEREKAAEKMEACQYKRLTEEKIQHVEENVAELEEEMQEKEMEISFLRHQLQEYCQKLSLIGVNVLDVEEERETPHDQEKSNIIRRNVSLPIFRHRKLQTELENLDLSSPFGQTISKRLGRYMSGPSQQLEEILDKEMTGTNGLNRTMSVQASCDNSEETIFPASKVVYDSHSELEIPGIEVHDVFEVPESQGSCSQLHVQTTKEMKNKGVVLSSTESLILPPQENQWLNKRNWPKNEISVNNLRRKNSESTIISKKDDLDQIKKRLEKLEREKGLKHENKVGRGEQQLKLLKDIYEQLTTIESHIKPVESPRKTQTQEDVAFASIVEAVLSFSI